MADIFREIDADTLDLALIGINVFTGFGVRMVYKFCSVEELGIVELNFRVLSVCLNYTCLCASVLHLFT